MPKINFDPKGPKPVADYISRLDTAHRNIFQEFYRISKKTIPDSTEGVSYGIPAFFYRGQPYAGLMVTQKHYGFYPYGSRAIDEFKDLLSEYSTSSGTIRFPLAKKLPLNLIKNIIISIKAKTAASFYGI